jgi:hypothetical protein
MLLRPVPAHGAPDAVAGDEHVVRRADLIEEPGEPSAAASTGRLTRVPGKLNELLLRSGKALRGAT